jgi:hypothetical protein
MRKYHNKYHNDDDDNDDDTDNENDNYSTEFIHRLQKNQKNIKGIGTMGDNIQSVYRNWYRQLREADADFHSRPALLSAIVPTITPTNGERAMLPRPAMIENESSPFMTKEITDYIHQTNVTHWLKYAAKNIRGRSVNVHIMHCGRATTAQVDSANDARRGVSLRDINRYRSCVYKIYAWFHFIHPYIAEDSSCSKTINLYFYFTPFKKRLPQSAGQTLGPANANTGFTYPCNSNPTTGGKTSTEIIIFREEEWFKVLLHETLHNTELDFGHTSTSLRDIFPGIRHSILLSEAYVETWARLLNLAFYVFYDIYGGNCNASEYTIAIRRCLYSERIFSLFQADKALKYMDLSISKLLDTDRNTADAVAGKYRENTNIFAYYVIAGIMVFAADEFIEWCTKTNEFSLIQASASKESGTASTKFKKLISMLVKNERIKNASVVIPELMNHGDNNPTTMRMTLWH